MTNPDLAALSEAATKGANPMLLECVENGVWQIRLVFGEGDDACHAMRQWADAYRSGDLVLINRERLRERVIAAMLAKLGPLFGSPEYLADPVKLARAEKRRQDSAEAYADAAIAAILGEA